MGNKSSSFAAGLSFIGTIGEYPDFDAEDDAKKLHKAFHKRIGIKEEVIIEIITTRSNEQRQELANVYKGCFGEAIVDRLDKISRNDLRRTLKALMRTPSEYAARELRKAMRGVGTDEESLIEIICTRGNDELEELKEVYNEIFDRDLESDIESETRGDFKRLLVAVLQCQREDCDEVDEDAAEADATELYEAGEDRWGTDETAFTLILARRSLLQLRAIIQKYEDVAGGSLESAIESECSRDLRKGYKAIVRLASNPAYYYARNLHKALIGVGTDEESTIRYLVNTSETMLTNVKEEFLESAGKTLDKSIKQNFRGDAKDVLRKIVKGNGYAAEWTPEEEEEEESEEEEEEEDEEVAEDAPISVKMKKGIQLTDVYIMNEGNGLVLDVEASGGSGTKVLQYGFHGGDNQLWDISYDRNSGQAIITSKLDENLVLSIEDDGGPETLCIEEFEEDKVNQLWRYKNNFFFNQGLVLTSQDDDEGCFLGTDSRTGDDNQQFYVVQKDE